MERSTSGNGHLRDDASFKREKRREGRFDRLFVAALVQDRAKGTPTGADVVAAEESGAEAEVGTGIGAEARAGAGSDRVSAGGSDGVGFAAVSMQQPWEPDPLRAYAVDGNRQP